MRLSAIWRFRGNSILISATVFLALFVSDPTCARSEPARPWLGVHLDEASAEDLAKLEPPRKSAVVVAWPNPNSPAEDAGLRRRDIVLAIDGKDIADTNTFIAAIALKAVGEKATLDIVRSGTRQTIEAAVGRRPDPAQPGASLIADVINFLEIRLANAKPDANLEMRQFTLGQDHRTRFQSLPLFPPFVSDHHGAVVQEIDKRKISGEVALRELAAMREQGKATLSAEQNARLVLHISSIILTLSHKDASKGEITANARGELAKWISDAKAGWLPDEVARSVTVELASVLKGLKCETAAVGSSNLCAEAFYLSAFSSVPRDDAKSLTQISRALAVHDPATAPQLGILLHRAILAFLPQAWGKRNASTPETSARVASGDFDGAAASIRNESLAYLRYAYAYGDFDARVRAEAFAVRMLVLHDGQENSKRQLARHVISRISPLVEGNLALGIKAPSFFSDVLRELGGAGLLNIFADGYKLYVWNDHFSLHESRPWEFPAGSIFPDFVSGFGPEGLLYVKSMDRQDWLKRLGRIEQLLEHYPAQSGIEKCGRNPQAACALLRAAKIVDTYGNHPNSALGMITDAVEVLEEYEGVDQTMYCGALMSLGHYQLETGEVAKAEATIGKARKLSGAGVDGARCGDRVDFWDLELGLARLRLDQITIESALTKLIDIRGRQKGGERPAEQTGKSGSTLAGEIVQHFLYWDCTKCDPAFRTSALSYLQSVLKDATAATVAANDASFVLALNAVVHREVFGTELCMAGLALIEIVTPKKRTTDKPDSRLCKAGAWSTADRKAATTPITVALAAVLTVDDNPSGFGERLKSILSIMRADDDDREEFIAKWQETAFPPRKLTEAFLDPRDLFAKLRLGFEAAGTLSDARLENVLLQFAQDSYDRYTKLFWRETGAGVLKAHSNVGVRARQLLPITLQIHTRLAEISLRSGDRKIARRHALKAFSFARARLQREWQEEPDSAVASIRPSTSQLRRVASLLHELAASNIGSPDRDIEAAAFEALQFVQLNDTSLSVVSTLRRKRDERPEMLALLAAETAAKEAYWSFEGKRFQGSIVDASLGDDERDRRFNEFFATGEAVKRARAKDDPHLSIEPVLLSTLQGLLKNNEAVVLSLADNQATRFAMLTSQGVRFWSAGLDRSSLERLIAQLREPLETGTTRFSFSAASELYEALFKPLGALKSAKIDKLFFMPDGPLHALPLHVLLTRKVTSTDDFRTNQLPWLVRDLGVAVVPSMQALVALRARQSARHDDRLVFAGIGDPQLQGRGDTRSAITSRALRSGQGRIAPRMVRSLPSLPETRVELEQIARLLSDGVPSRTRLWLGRDATRKELLAADLSKYEVISFATHGAVAGEIDGANEPGLILTPSDDDNADDDNGFLSTTDISHLKLDAALIILSACNTAASDGRPQAEGLSGLARAFFSAGARSIIATSWSIPSISTVDLMTAMAQQRSKDPALDWTQALRAATLRLIDGLGPPSNADPRSWGAFLVVGDAAP